MASEMVKKAKWYDSVTLRMRVTRAAVAIYILAAVALPVRRVA